MEENLIDNMEDIEADRKEDSKDDMNPIVNGLSNETPEQNSGVETTETDRGDQSEDDFIKCIEKNLNIKSMNPLNYSSLALAYIGDDAYDLIIRTLTLSYGNSNVNKMNKKASSLVKAETQSKMVKIIEPYLSEEEMGAYKRGRNAKSVTTAKNASVNDYRRATGFEALMGYLYLKKRFNRMTELVKIGLEGLGEL